MFAHATSRSGFSLIEVMLTFAILITGIFGLFSHLMTLERVKTLNREDAKAKQIAQMLMERIQGSSWHLLGKADQPWSWHRLRDNDPGAFTAALYDEALPATPPPLCDRSDVHANNNLIRLGILSAPSGLEDLRVYLEYYRMGITEVGVSPTSWNTACEGGMYTLGQNPATFDLGTTEDAVIIRIIVQWASADLRSGSGQNQYLGKIAGGSCDHTYMADPEAVLPAQCPTCHKDVKWRQVNVRSHELVAARRK